MKLPVVLGGSARVERGAGPRPRDRARGAGHRGAELKYAPAYARAGVDWPPRRQDHRLLPHTTLPLPEDGQALGGLEAQVLARDRSGSRPGGRASATVSPPGKNRAARGSTARWMQRPATLRFRESRTAVNCAPCLFAPETMPFVFAVLCIAVCFTAAPWHKAKEIPALQRCRRGGIGRRARLKI